MLASISTRINTLLLVLLVLMVAAVIGVLATRAGAGPLDPPGVPGSTAGVLEPGTPISSVPYTISQPGYYYLTGNLVGGAGQNGITIQANDVTLDLKGFTMGVSGGAQSAITEGPSSPQRFHWNIRNGTIDGWQYGINAPNVSDSHVSDLIINGSYAAAIYAGGAIVVDHVTLHNTSSGNGFFLGPVAQVSDCFVDGAAQDLIRVGDQSTVTRCSTVGGTTGIRAGAASRVDSCNVRFATSVGISALGGSTVTNNTIGGTGSGSGGTAVFLAGSTLMSNNLIDGVTGAGYGIAVSGSANRIVDNQIQHAQTGIVFNNSGGNAVYRNAVRDLQFIFSDDFLNQKAGVEAPATATNPWSNLSY